MEAVAFCEGTNPLPTCKPGAHGGDTIPQSLSPPNFLLVSPTGQMSSPTGQGSPYYNPYRSASWNTEQRKSSQHRKDQNFFALGILGGII